MTGVRHILTDRGARRLKLAHTCSVRLRSLRVQEEKPLILALNFRHIRRALVICHSKGRDLQRAQKELLLQELPLRCQLHVTVKSGRAISQNGEFYKPEPINWP